MAAAVVFLEKWKVNNKQRQKIVLRRESHVDLPKFQWLGVEVLRWVVDEALYNENQTVSVALQMHLSTNTLFY